MESYDKVATVAKLRRDYSDVTKKLLSDKVPEITSDDIFAACANCDNAKLTVKLLSVQVERLRMSRCNYCNIMRHETALLARERMAQFNRMFGTI